MNLESQFNNLISNAIKFRDTNKLSTIIQVNIKETLSGVVISNSDNGIGIPQKSQRHAFKIYFNAENSINTGGLGMFNVKQVVRKLRGRITLLSETGTGTTFKIDIPSKSSK